MGHGKIKKELLTIIIIVNYYNRRVMSSSVHTAHTSLTDV